MRRLVADKVYDANDLRDFLAQGTEPVISPTPRRSVRPASGNHAYRARNLIERAFCRPKDWRGIETRYDKTARNFPAAPALSSPPPNGCNESTPLVEGEKRPNFRNVAAQITG